MDQICIFRPLEVSGALSQLDVVPLRAVLMLARVMIGEPADFSVGSNVSFVNFPVDLGVLNRRGSVGSPVFAAPLVLAMFLQDVSTIFSRSVMGGGAGSLREVPPHLVYGAHRAADLGTEANVEPDGIMVENNFKVYAYTTSQLQVRLLGLFCRNIAYLPNKVVGQISAETVKKAMRRDITAENIPRSLESTAHFRLLKRAASGESIVPGNVRAQLQVGQDHNSRISCDRGVLFEWDLAECDLATFDMIMKHAVTNKGLQWSCKEYVDGQDFSLVVKATAAQEFRCSWRSMWLLPVCDSSSRGVVRTLSYNSRKQRRRRHSSAGYVWVNRVPGNIYFWTYSYAYLFSSSCQETQGISVSYHVDHVCFSTDTDISYVLFVSILWFSFYIEREFAGVHSKCFNCRLCPRCLQTEIGALFLKLSHVAHSSPKSWNEGILCNDSRPFSLSGVLCTVNASVANCSR